MKRLWPHSWGSALPFGLAVLALLFIAWTAWYLARAPYVGTTWSWISGIVDTVDPDGPAAGLLVPGDRIRSIDGASLLAARRAFPGRSGERMELVVEDAGAPRRVALRWSRQPLPTILRNVEPLLIALAFWSLGVAIIAYASPGMQAWLGFAFSLALSTTLTAGAVSWLGPLWTVRLFGVLLWWVGPLALLFHLRFPTWGAEGSIPRRAYGVFGVALLGSLPEVVGDSLALRARVPALSVARLIWPAACLLGVVVVLIQAYRRTPSPAARGRVGLVTVGGAIAFLPLLTLSLLPDALLGHPTLPYEWAFLFLLLVPLCYGYAIFRYRLLPVDRYISRAATATLAIALLGGAYLTVHAASLRLLPVPLRQHPTVIFTLALLLAATAGAAHRRLRIAVDRFFYGGSHDYQSAVRHVSQALEPEPGDTALAQNLCAGVREALQLEWACLLLAGDDGTLHTAGVSGMDAMGHGTGLLRLASERQVAQYFQQELRPIDGATLRALLDDAALSPAERQLLSGERCSFWMPLVAGEQLLGLLILGPQRGSAALSATDREIVQVIARQASSALENSRLSAELRQRVTDSEQLHRQLLRAREAERKRLARELHDEVIQELASLKHQLEAVRTFPDGARDDRLAQLEEWARRIIVDLRRLCIDLRPPALDTQGLVGAMRGHVQAVEQQASFQVRFMVEGDETRCLSEEVELCLLRVVQEALNNIQKHAAARQVTVRLALDPREARLTVVDDGCGFDVPPRLGQLLDAHRFGLVGLRERLELLHGALEIVSAPGRGTVVQAQVPLDAPIEAASGKEGQHDHSTITQ